MEGYVYELKGEQGKSRFDELQEQIDSLDTRVDALEDVVVTFVTLDTAQTITGDKEITGNVHIDGAQGKAITLGQSADNPRVTIDQWSGVVGFTDTEGGFNEFNPCDSDFGAIPSFDRLGVYDLNANGLYSGDLEVADSATIENLRVKTVKAGNTTVKGQNVYNFEEPCTFNFGITSSGETEYYGVFNTYDPDYDGPRFNFLAIGGLTVESRLTVESNLYIPSTIRAYTPNVGTYTITFPTKNGTVALTSDLYDYLPLTGGTIVSRIAENTDENVISNREITIRSNDRNHYSTLDKNGVTVSTLGSYGSTKVQLDGVLTTYGRFGESGHKYASNGIHKILNNVEFTYTFPSESGMLALGELKTTWSELKALRDASKLVPGRQYRITDYVCTTAQANTSSAGHQFDIIVVADSVNKLNEVARACLHEGDTYFANSKLEAWQLWYCLDNDDTRFEWADTSYIEIVGTIVANDVSWDRYEAGDFPSGRHPYAWKSSDGTRVYTDSTTPSVSDEAYTSSSPSPSYAITEIVMGNKYTGKGVIYHMVDEFDNDVPYDFKNILFTKSGKYTNAYTFSYTEDSVIKDASLSLSNGCYGNSMKEYLLGGKQQLNFNVFYSSSVSVSSLMCYCNTFGYDCYNNTFREGCSCNTFISNCRNNIFGESCSYNTFNGSCFNNTFDNDCFNNIFDSYCSSNLFGQNCTNNTFGAYCTSNTFGDDCFDNTFGSSCSSNVFSSNCPYNTFGCNCDHNILGDTCSNNTFGNNCTYNTFGESSSPINYCRGILLDNLCSYLEIISTDTSATSSNWLQNIHIHLGVAGSSSDRKTITIPDRNLQYTTDVYPTGSTEMFI